LFEFIAGGFSQGLLCWSRAWLQFCSIFKARFLRAYYLSDFALQLVK